MLVCVWTECIALYRGRSGSEDWSGSADHMFSGGEQLQTLRTGMHADIVILTGFHLEF